MKWKAIICLLLCILRVVSAVDRDAEGNDGDIVLRGLQFGICGEASTEHYLVIIEVRHNNLHAAKRLSFLTDYSACASSVAASSAATVSSATGASCFTASKSSFTIIERMMFSSML